MMSSKEPEIVYKQVGDQLVSGVRYQGEPSGLGSVFESVGQQCDEYICGPSFIVTHYGTGVQDGIDVDVCFPVSQPVETGDIRSWVLEGGEALSLLHRGPYESLGESYWKLYGYLGEHGLISQLSGREVYLEYNADNPEKNVTELQVFLHKWEDLLAESVGRVLGEDVRVEVVQGIQALTPHSSLDDRVQWVSATMGRLDECTDEMQKFEVLSPCADVFPQERIDKLRAVYEQNGSVDDVLEAMAEDPDWYESPVKDGDVIYMDKIIFDRKGYEQATTEAERRKCRCHCPIARRRLDEVHPTMCYCSTGWYRRLWEGILGKSVWVELLECLTRGDDCCLFAVHI
jgi:effector-binding domain-containing protein